MYPAIKIANYFIEKALEENHRLTPMKLQKLVYFAHGWYLAKADRPLIDEKIEAWQFGPVIPSLYRKTKQFGNSNITELLQEFTFDFSRLTPQLSIEDEFIKSYLDTIWKVYSKHTAYQLSNSTHLPDTPWSNVAARFNHQIPKNQDIENEDIQAYFKGLLNAGK